MISIVSPAHDSPFNATAPTFNISIDEGINDSLWYKVQFDSNEYNFTGNTFQINQTAWTNALLINSTVTITFYVNDSRGYNDSVIGRVVKDTMSPSISIHDPMDDESFEFNAPDYNITILEGFLHYAWYRLGDNQTKHFISSNSTGTINQTEWESFPDGNITIAFYANDTAGNLGQKNVTVKKDTTAPTISISWPLPSSNVVSEAPSFAVSISGVQINTTWYRIWDGSTWSANCLFSGSSGTINQVVWNLVWRPLSHGDVITLEFFVNDSIGRVASDTVSVKKHDPSEETPDIPDLLVILIIVIPIAAVIGVIMVFIKKGSGKEVERIDKIIDEMD